MTLDQFFTPAVYGIQDACASFGCQYQWTGSEKNVVSEMVNAMQTAIAEKADGIAVCLVVFAAQVMTSFIGQSAEIATLQPVHAIARG